LPKGRGITHTCLNFGTSLGVVVSYAWACTRRAYLTVRAGRLLVMHFGKRTSQYLTIRQDPIAHRDEREEKQNNFCIQQGRADRVFNPSQEL
jgi:hypothetical protein